MALLSTPTSAQAWRPDVTGHAPDDVIPDALIQRITSNAGTVEGDAVSVRVPIVADDDAAIVPEGTKIPEAAPELAEAVVTTIKIAKLLRVSREQFLQEGAAQRLSTAAARSIIKKADDVLLNTPAPTAPASIPPAGILHQGIPDLGPVTGTLDALVDALATVQTGGGTPDAFVLSPTAWAALRKFKTAEGSAQSLLGVGSQDAQPLILGVPVIVNQAMPDGQGLLVDRDDIVSAVGPVMTAQSDDVYFETDSIGLRVMFRFGATVVHPARHMLFSVGTTGE